MNEILEAFVILSQSTKYYDWLKKHPQEVSLYRIGRAFEYATMKKLRKHGWYCVRKFGSKGFEDIVAYRHGVGIFVQCKYSRYQDTFPKQFDLSGLIKLAAKHGALPIFAGVRQHRMYFAVYKERKGWVEWKPS